MAKKDTVYERIGTKTGIDDTDEKKYIKPPILPAILRLYTRKALKISRKGEAM